MNEKCWHCNKNIEDSSETKVHQLEYYYHADSAWQSSDGTVKFVLKTDWKCTALKMSLGSGSTSGMSEQRLSKILNELKQEILDLMENQF